MSLAGAAAALAELLEPGDAIWEIVVYAGPLPDGWDRRAALAQETVCIGLNRYASDQAGRYLAQPVSAVGALALALAAVELHVGPCELLDPVRVDRHPTIRRLVTVSAQWAQRPTGREPRVYERPVLRRTAFALEGTELEDCATCAAEAGGAPACTDDACGRVRASKRPPEPAPREDVAAAAGGAR